MGYFTAEPTTIRPFQMTQNLTMLPEWATQQAVLLAWPHENTDWKPWLNEIESDYAALTQAIAKEATPIILCRDGIHQQHIQNLLLTQELHYPPIFKHQPYNDTWCRDYGPITVGHSDQFRLLDFQFTGWGDKYAANLDNQITQKLTSLWCAPITTLAFELEGGSIETDGNGTLLTTYHCQLSSNRNTGLSNQEIENTLKQSLGIQRILWLQHGALLGDDTDSHIDNLARFCDQETIAYASCDDPKDSHYAELKAMEQELGSFRTNNGQPYRLIPIAIPTPQLDGTARLPGSYINFLILNKSVIVPVFDCPEDQQALSKLQTCFPNKNIVAVPGKNLIRQFGGPHCATMQLPAGIVDLNLNT